jgi:hypothetical protein
MTKRKFYKTTITVTVLSEEPLEGHRHSLADVVFGITEGDWSGEYAIAGRQELNGLQAVNELLRQGIDPGFFRLCEHGHDNYSDDDEPEIADGAPPTCILTGKPGEDPDDCTTHEHEKRP